MADDGKLAVVVRIWLSSLKPNRNTSADGMGHVSLEFDKFYVSLWPENRNDKRRAILIPESHKFISSFDVDCSDQYEARKPDKTFSFHSGLNKVNMANEIKNYMFIFREGRDVYFYSCSTELDNLKTHLDEKLQNKMIMIPALIKQQQRPESEPCYWIYANGRASGTKLTKLDPQPKGVLERGQPKLTSDSELMKPQSTVAFEKDEGFLETTQFGRVKLSTTMYNFAKKDHLMTEKNVGWCFLGPIVSGNCQSCVSMVWELLVVGGIGSMISQSLRTVVASKESAGGSGNASTDIISSEPSKSSKGLLYASEQGLSLFVHSPDSLANVLKVVAKRNEKNVHYEKNSSAKKWYKTSSAQNV